MSSNTFWTEIRPDPMLRKRLIIAGIVLALLGIPVILSLPLSDWALCLLVAAWLGWCALELVALCRAHRRCAGLRLSSDGELLVLERHAGRPARLLPGCLVFDGIAWLRLRDDCGRSWGELVTGKHRESEEWRRFQVIFRHTQPC